MPFTLDEKSIQVIQKKDPTVNVLNLGGGSLLLDEAVGRLVELLNKNHFITELNLSERCIGDKGGKALAKLKYIKKLNLFRNNISEGSVGELVSNDSIEELDIGQNNLDDKAALIIVRNATQTKLEVSKNEGVSREMYAAINRRIKFNRDTLLALQRLFSSATDVKERYLAQIQTYQDAGLNTAEISPECSETAYMLPDAFYTYQLLKIDEERILLHGRSSPRNAFCVFHTKTRKCTLHQYEDFKETKAENQFHTREIKQIDDYYIDDNDQNCTILLSKDFKALAVQNKPLFNFQSIQPLNDHYYVIFKSSGSVHVFPKFSLRQMMEADEKSLPSFPIIENREFIHQMIVPRNNCVALREGVHYSDVTVYSFDEKQPNAKLAPAAEISFCGKIQYILTIDERRILVCLAIRDSNRIELGVVDIKNYSIISHFYFYIDNHDIWKCEYGTTRQDQTIFLMFSTSYKRPKYVIAAINILDNNGFYYVLPTRSVLAQCSLLVSNQIAYINEDQKLVIQNAPAPSLRKESILNVLKLIIRLRYLKDLLSLIAEYAYSAHSEPLSIRAASFFSVRRTQELPSPSIPQTLTCSNYCNVS